MAAINWGIPYNLNLPGFLTVGGTLTVGNIAGSVNVNGNISATNISTTPGNGVIPKAGSDGKIDIGFIPTNNLQITFRAGTDAERAVTVFADGEPAYATDTKRVWLGDGSTLGGLSEFALPAQGGNNGKFLTTDGSISSWVNISMPGYSYVTGGDIDITPDIGHNVQINSPLTLIGSITVSGSNSSTIAGNLFSNGFRPNVSITKTVSSLPNAGFFAGFIFYISDATQTMADAGTIVTGGGSNKVLVFSNGTNWVVV